MAYLDQGLNNSYSVVLTGNLGQNYKVVMSPDGTVVTSEKTALKPGVYPVESEVPETDKNIAQSIMSMYNKNVKGYDNFSISQFISHKLDTAQELNFRPIKHIPKMTKALATNLASIKEAMVLLETDDSSAYDFLCFGYRRQIAESLTRNFNPIFVFSDRFFTGASFETRFKTALWMFSLSSEEILITNDPVGKDKISIVMGVNWQEHTTYLDRSILDE